MRLPRSIRFRLTLWYVATLGAVLALSGYAVNLTTGRLFELELDDDLRTQSQALAAGYDPATAQIDAERLGFPIREGWILVLLDARGDIIQSAGVERESGYRRVTTNVERDGRVLGTLVVGAPMPSSLDMTHRHLLAVLAIFALTLVLGALPGYWLASRAMRPVRDITRLARQIGETDLSRRLHMEGRDEIGELATTFDAMLARLEAAFERQRQFTADASHELRTPVSIISLEAQRALERPRTAEDYQEALATIRAESGQMAGLVADLLALARVESGQTSPYREALDLSDIVLEVVERLAPVARERHLQVSVRDLPELLITGDRALLVRMLSNVIDNAIKYTAGVGSQIHVATGCRTDAGQACAWVLVEDDGPGIKPNDLPHLFERFYRADAARNGHAAEASGHGLGLAIARWVARAHDGEISARNRPAGGAAFEVVLPIAMAPRYITPR